MQRKRAGSKERRSTKIRELEDMCVKATRMAERFEGEVGAGGWRAYFARKEEAVRGGMIGE